MGSFTLTWIIAIVFVALAFWGANVPTTRRSTAVIWIVSVLVLFNLLAQSYIFRGQEAALAPGAGHNAERMAEVQEFLNNMALMPGSLSLSDPSQWYRIITSTFLHYGWVHLLVNIWFLILFGHVLEQQYGAKKFLAVVAAGLLIPPALDGFFGNISSPTGGFGGVVYSVMGAYLVSFPRSRIYGAVNYDLRFWATVFLIILPITMITRYAGMTLTEPVLIMGILGFFLLIQPEHARISAAAGVVVLYKLLFDLLLIQPIVSDVSSNSPFRIIGGFAIGVAGGLLVSRMRGWRITWPDETKALPTSSRNTGRMSVAQLEAAGQKSEEAARLYLGQRVFVGDSSRATDFYRNVVLKKFPDLSLPLQEQMALARLLHFKGYDQEALHAYEILLRTPDLPDEYWLAWLKAAELVLKLEPKREMDALRYLDKFEQGSDLLMRDRIEAERLRSVLPASPQPADAEVVNLVPLPEPAGAQAGEINYGDEHKPDTSPHGLKKKRFRPKHEVPALDFPKASPRTFTYREGSAPETVVMPGSRQKPSSSEHSETLLSYWKPLPCITEKTTPGESMLERRVKNPRVADDAAKPGMYGTEFRARSTRGGTSRGRLSRLELARTEARQNVPEADAMPLRYGGLEEHQKAGAPPHTGFKLRGESKPTPRNKINRAPDPKP